MLGVLKLAAGTRKQEAEAVYSSSVTEGSNDYQPTPAKREQIRQKQTELGVTSSELFNKNVTGVLDRNKTSGREAVQLMVPIAAALGHETSSLPLSRSTVHRMRQKTRRNLLKQPQWNIIHVVQ